LYVCSLRSEMKQTPQERWAAAGILGYTALPDEIGNLTKNEENPAI
jgi:hypothetical protein